MILSQFEPWLKPELRLALRRPDVNVHSIFLARKEEETVWAVTKNCWTHALMVSYLVAGKRLSSRLADDHFRRFGHRPREGHVGLTYGRAPASPPSRMRRS